MSVWRVLFSPFGRTGRRAFWLAGPPLLLAHTFMVYGAIVLVLPLGYLTVCVWGKRLHDLGKTAWLALIPLLVPWAFGVAIAVGVIRQWDVPSESAGVSSSEVFGAGFALFAIVEIALHIWVGAAPGQDGGNKHGPDPRRRDEAAPEAST